MEGRKKDLHWWKERHERTTNRLSTIDREHSRELFDIITESRLVVEGAISRTSSRLGTVSEDVNAFAPSSSFFDVFFDHGQFSDCVGRLRSYVLSSIFL